MLPIGNLATRTPRELCSRASLAAIALLAIVVVLDVASLRHRSRTYDEKNHMGYGMDVLHGNFDRGGHGAASSEMPVSALNAAPRYLTEIVEWPQAVEDRLRDIGVARAVTIVFGVVLAFYVYAWSRALYGDVGGLLSLFLCAFSPNLIAHSGLVTTDLYTACFTTMALHHFWRFARSGHWLDGVASAATLGLAQLAKYTCILLYAVFLLIVAVRAVPRLRAWWRAPAEDRERPPVGRAVGWVCVYVLVNLAVINLGFLGHGSMTRLADYRFRSQLLHRVQVAAGIAGAIPVPVPYPYLDGLDSVVATERRGVGSGMLYLAGEIRSKQGRFAGYYLWALLFKEPLATQTLIVCAFLAYWRKRAGQRFLDDEIFVLVPVACFTLYFNFVFRNQIGLRFFLVVLPLLYVFCGSLARGWPLAQARPRRVLYALLGFLVVSVLSYFPYYLSYFNELVWDRRLAYKVLADSNLDWGQGRYHLERYLESHPQAIFEPDRPTSGEIIVGINKFVGVFRRIRGVPGVEKYRWLRDNFEPVEHVAHTYLVFHVDPEALRAALARSDE